MGDGSINLHFEIEKGDPIDSYYFSARIKLTDKSKNELRDKLGESVGFNNLDSYFDLNPENFYIYYNKYTKYEGRNELYIKDEDGNCLESNLPLNRYLFSVELATTDGSVIDYGFYPQHEIYNDYKKEKILHDENNTLLPTTLDVLENLLSNTHGFTISDISSQWHNETIEREARKIRDKREADDKLNVEHAELEELINNNQIVLFKVVKGENIDDERSVALLQSRNTHEYITLDHQKYYIAQYQDYEYLHGIYENNNSKSMLMDLDSVFFVLNKNSYHNLKSGFYEIDIDNYERYLSDKQYPFHYGKFLNSRYDPFTDDELSEKLSNPEALDSLNYAEQIIMFFQDQHPEILNRLVDDLVRYGTKNPEGTGRIEDFIHNLEKYHAEFSQWAKRHDIMPQKELADQQEKSVEKKYDTEINEQKVIQKRSVESDDEQKIIESVIKGMNSVDNSIKHDEHPLKINAVDPFEVGKYKVELQVTYEDVKNFYNNAIYDKYHAKKEYNYEQVKVLHDEIILPISNSHYDEKPIVLPGAYITNGHLFIQDYDFGTLNDFNEMFYKHDDLFAIAS